MNSGFPRNDVVDKIAIFDYHGYNQKHSQVMVCMSNYTPLFYMDAPITPVPALVTILNFVQIVRQRPKSVISVSWS